MAAIDDGSKIGFNGAMFGRHHETGGLAAESASSQRLFHGKARDSAQVFRCDAADLAAAVRRLPEEDALSLPLLTEAARQSLLAATADLSYRPARPQIGEGEKAVQQDFDICMHVPDDSALSRFAALFETLTNDALAHIDPPCCPPLRYNNLVVQRYRPVPVGITPHRDHICYQGLVSLLVLEGDGCFSITADRAGSDAREIPCPPGGLLLMRGAGFAGMKTRPFHQLRDIRSGRVSFGLRYDAHAEAALKTAPEAAAP